LLKDLRQKTPYRIRTLIIRINRYPYAGVIFLVLLTLAMHLTIINNTKSYLFDEGYYVADARLVMAGQPPLNLEHPPVGKFFILNGIRLFGDNPWGWRFFSAISGTICVALFYFICRRLKMRSGAPFMATFVFALENLNFVQSSTAMLDVYMVTFMMAGFLCFLYDRPLAAGLCIAGSALCKFTGILGACTVFFWWLFRPEQRRNTSSIVIFVCSFFVFFALLFWLLYSLYLGDWVNPTERLKEIFKQASGLTYTGTIQYNASRPWQWILQPVWMVYSFIPQYIAMVSPTIWAVMIPIIIYAVYLFSRGNRTGIFSLAWFAGTYLPVLIAVLLTDRVTFIYYFYPVLGSFYIIIGYVLSELIVYWQENKNTQGGQLALICTIFYLTAHVMTFIYLSPLGVPLVKWLPLGI